MIERTGSGFDRLQRRLVYLPRVSRLWLCFLLISNKMRKNHNRNREGREREKDEESVCFLQEKERDRQTHRKWNEKNEWICANKSCVERRVVSRLIVVSMNLLDRILPWTSCASGDPLRLLLASECSGHPSCPTRAPTKIVRFMRANEASRNTHDIDWWFTQFFRCDFVKRHLYGTCIARRTGQPLGRTIRLVWGYLRWGHSLVRTDTSTELTRLKWVAVPSRRMGRSSASRHTTAISAPE